MIDIIVTTYNRPTKVYELVIQLLSLPVKPVNIIVVDSSDTTNEVFQEISEVKYMQSSHKNQPYQRFLGYMNSESDYLVFLDDDMEVVDVNFIQKTSEIFRNSEISGIAIKFENKHEDSLLAQMPSTRFRTKNSQIKKIKGWLTGYPELKSGKFGLCGNRGKQPNGGGLTEWVSGGAFAAKRSAMFQDFNFQLFDIFEKRLGMGEDGIIGYGLSKQGTLVYHDELFFLHNDQKDSTYTMDKQAFARRVMFSRLYLSLERQRLNNKSFLNAKIHFHYYAFWRLTGYLFNYTISPSQNRKDMLMGSLTGWVKASKFKYCFSEKIIKYWINEAGTDSSK